jgi:hypothetical protein
MGLFSCCFGGGAAPAPTAAAAAEPSPAPTPPTPGAPRFVFDDEAVKGINNSGVRLASLTGARPARPRPAAALAHTSSSAAGQGKYGVDKPVTRHDTPYEERICRVLDEEERAVARRREKAGDAAAAETAAEAGATLA